MQVFLIERPMFQLSTPKVILNVYIYINEKVRCFNNVLRLNIAMDILYRPRRKHWSSIKNRRTLIDKSPLIELGVNAGAGGFGRSNSTFTGELAVLSILTTS